MNISPKDVKALRDKTGAGMMDCKKALVEAEGDFEKAIEILRKKGASVAAKRAGKAANEGIVVTRIFEDGKAGAIVEVNCETDFVAKSGDFVEFANFVADAVVDAKPENVEALLNSQFQDKKVADVLNEIIGKIGEKIEISRFAIVNTENGLVVDYVHAGAKLGVLVVAEGVQSEFQEELASLLKDVAMQVAAMKPGYVSREEVPEEVIRKEKEIYMEVARKEGKPEQILDKIATGKLNKFYQENCLLEQAFVKDNTKTVGQLIEEFNKEHSASVKLKAFKRFHLSDENKA
jgi:elongation factor Ts